MRGSRKKTRRNEDEGLQNRTVPLFVHKSTFSEEVPRGKEKIDGAIKEHDLDRLPRNHWRYKSLHRSGIDRINHRRRGTGSLSSVRDEWKENTRKQGLLVARAKSWLIYDRLVANGTLPVNTCRQSTGRQGAGGWEDQNIHPLGARGLPLRSGPRWTGFESALRHRVTPVLCLSQRILTPLHLHTYLRFSRWFRPKKKVLRVRKILLFCFIWGHVQSSLKCTI